MKSIAVLGSTGSIGQNTLAIARHHKESFRIASLAAHSNIDLLQQQILEFNPDCVAVFDEKQAIELRKRVPTKVFSGVEGILRCVCLESVDFVVMAIVGMAALLPTIEAIKCRKTIGLANKEVLVAAGKLITTLAQKEGVTLLPIDSEHSALFQCLENRKLEEVQRLIITASGGPFRSFSEEALKNVTLDQALNHPTWKMGNKVTIDSSTLMNKGLEVIEAHFLFQIPVEKIDVVIHPQSIIHSFVEFIDGSMLAQLSEPHMIYPIQYALTYPSRKKGIFPPFDFTKARVFDFYPPDYKKFPALALAFEALKKGKSLACYLNSANEVLVNRLLKREFSWHSMGEKLEKLLSRHQPIETDSLEAILTVDQMAREEAAQVM